MWQNILKKPITIGRTRIGMKPFPEDNEDCCERAREQYSKVWERSKDTNYSGRRLDIMDRGRLLEEHVDAIHKLQCETFYRILETLAKHGDSWGWSKSTKEDWKKVLDDWNKCEEG